MPEAPAIAAAGKIKADVEMRPRSAIDTVLDRLEYGEVPSRVMLEFEAA